MPVNPEQGEFNAVKTVEDVRSIRVHVINNAVAIFDEVSSRLTEDEDTSVQEAA